MAERMGCPILFPVYGRMYVQLKQSFTINGEGILYGIAGSNSI